jgi:hypothetical protein
VTNPTYGTWPPTDVTISYSAGVSALTRAADGTLVTPDCLCPDLLRLANIGAADGWRGRVVRLFFVLMQAWPPRRPTRALIVSGPTWRRFVRCPGRWDGREQ